MESHHRGKKSAGGRDEVLGEEGAGAHEGAAVAGEREVEGGDRAREMTYRFGINLGMYILTGNYKEDQVHIPDLLDRLGTSRDRAD